MFRREHVLSFLASEKESRIGPIVKFEQLEHEIVDASSHLARESERAIKPQTSPGVEVRTEFPLLTLPG